jgi:ornithine cyclodeaminase
MKTDKIAIIQQEQIVSLNIPPKECIKWVEEGFRIKDQVQMPPKPSVHPQGEDFMTTMPCLLPEQNGHKRFGIKVVNRIEGQEPALSSMIYLYDAKTGGLLAIMDGDWITAMRTGAVATLAARLFKKDGVDTYSIMGLGNIARATAMCLIADNQNKNIKIKLLRYKDQAEQFIERFKYATNVTFEIIDDKEEFISQADVVISCVTVATELLFPDDTLFRKGITVIPVHVRGFQNCDLFFDKVFGDDTGQIRNWKYFSKFRQYDELHHVLLGLNPGRTNQDERILSYNYGLGLHDIVYASKIFDLININDCESFLYNRQAKKLWM